MESQNHGEPEKLSPTVEGVPYREKLPRPVLYNMMAAIGNSELKGMLLGLMSSDQFYTSRQMERVVAVAQGENLGWKPDHKTLFSACSESLEPIGLVARSATDSTLRTIGYAKTTYGALIGDSVAGHMLDFSERHPAHALKDILGSTFSPGKTEVQDVEGTSVDVKARSPETRIRIFEELLSVPSLPISQTELAALTGVKLATLKAQLDAMSAGDNGIISHAGREANSAYTAYKLERLPEEDYLVGSHRFVREIYAVIAEDPAKFWTQKEIIAKLSEGETAKTYKNIATFKATISKCLNDEIKKGNIANISPVSKDDQVEINLTDTQRKLLEDLLNVVYKCESLSPENLEQGRRHLSEILSDPSRVRRLLEKARSHSTHASKTLEDVEGYILKVIQQNPNLSRREIASQVSESLENRPHPASIFEYISKLQTSGTIDNLVVDGVNRWFIKQVPDQQAGESQG